MPAASTQAAFTAFLEFCKTTGLDYTVRSQARLVEVLCTSPYGEVPVRLQISREEKFFEIRIEAPFTVPDNPKRFEILKIIFCHASQIEVGHAELDFDTGSLCFRINLLLAATVLNAETVEHLCFLAISGAAVVFQRIDESLNAKPEEPIRDWLFAIDKDDVVTDEDEEIYAQCIEVIRNENRAAAGLFQRRLRLGYTRAHRMMDILERRGIVGPKDGTKDRSILIDLNDCERN